MVPARVTCGKFLPDLTAVNQTNYFREIWQRVYLREESLHPHGHACRPTNFPPPTPSDLGTLEHSWPDVGLRNHFCSCRQLEEAQDELQPRPCCRAPSVTNILRAEQDGLFSRAGEGGIYELRSGRATVTLPPAPPKWKHRSSCSPPAAELKPLACSNIKSHLIGSEQQ